jgi:aminoglycoside phosphotransferase (APT) family kinase protein
MMNGPVFFRSEADFTPANVTTALRALYPQVRVADVSILGRHQGSASHVNLKLGYAANPDGRLPEKIFVKTLLDVGRDQLPSGFAENLQGDLAVALYATETRAYAQIASKIDIETPRIFAADLGERPGDFYLFMEDLNDRSAVCPKVTQPLTVDQVSRLIGELAKLHAAYWESPRFATDLAWTDTATTGVNSDFLRQGGWSMVDIELAVPFKAAILDEIGIDRPHVQAAFWRRQNNLESGPVTLLHGDPHPGNVYFLPSGAVGLLDWQLARRGPWTHDVSYAITSALDPDDRRRCEADLLAAYRSDLVGRGVAAPPSLDEMWVSHRQCPAWGLPMWGITPAAMYSEAEIGTVMRRFAAAWRDFDTSKALGF